MAKTPAHGRKGKAERAAREAEGHGAPEEKPAVNIGGIPVHCAHDAIVPIEGVVPNPRNPNTHPERQIDLLAKIIKAQGWRAPVTMSTRSGFIVRGHGRYLAALRLGLSAVPVDKQGYASEAEEWADLIADNRIAELAEMDMAKLKEDLLALDDGAFDMELTGFDGESLEDLLVEFGTPPPIPGATAPLPPPPVTGPDNRAGRFLLVYLTEGERRAWEGLLGIAADSAQVVFTVADCPALRPAAGAKEGEEAGA